MYYGPNRRRENRRRNERRRGRNSRRDFWRQYYDIYPERQRPVRWQGLLADEWSRLRGHSRTNWFIQRPPPRDRSTAWNTRPAAGGGSELMSQRGGALPGHPNIPRVYDEHVDSLRGRQNQNPHWIGSRTNHRDPNITQQSMEDFIQRHNGPSRSNRQMNVAGAGLLSTLQGANQSDLADYI